MAQIPYVANAMTATDYLQLASLVINDRTLTLRKDSVTERDTLRALAPLGLRKGVRFDPERLTPAQRSAVQKGFDAARAVNCSNRGTFA